MLTTSRTLTLTLSFVMAGAACAEETPKAGDKGDPSQPEGAPPGAPRSVLSEALNACALPRSCSWPVSLGRPDEKDSIRCVVAELAADRPLSVDTVLSADGPTNGCEVHQELHFLRDKGTAYYLWRKRCGNTDEHQLRRCTMLGHEAYVSCLVAIDSYSGGPTGITCSTPEDWVTACTEVDQATCS